MRPPSFRKRVVSHEIRPPAGSRVLVASLALMLHGCISSEYHAPDPASDSTPPMAQKVPHAKVLHGERRVDNYFWLREKTNPAVREYLEAENAYCNAVMKPTEGFQEKLYREILSHIKETDLEVPYRENGWFYYSRTEQGKQYSIHCRKRGSLDAPEEVTLDLNELAKTEKYLRLGAYDVSDDGHLLAHSFDRTGFSDYTLQIKDLRSGQVLPERVERIRSVAWATDNRTLFYTLQDDAKRAYRLYKHRLGTPVAQDELVFEEKDERFNVSLGRSRSRRFVLLTVGSLTASEVRYLSADQPDGVWKLIAPRRQDHEYDVEHHGDFFYIRSNDKGRHFRLVKAPVDDPVEARWQEVVPHRPEVMLEGHFLFSRHYVLFEREGGLPHLRITDLSDGKSHRVAFPEAVYSAFPHVNPEFDTGVFRYGYQSLVTPGSVFDYDMERREAKLLKQREVPGGYESSRYHTERLHATASDGTRIPVSLVYRADVKRDGRAPMWLTGYGSYGAPYSTGFSPARLSLLDRGVICAFAHIRGGGDLGKTWHDAGRMLNKRNTFTDFIAVAEHLMAQRYTSKERLVIEGGSAGGLLMGAVVNLRPDLFRAVIADVPFVDVINTMLDESLPLTVGEFEEWGNPKKPAEYAYMMTYSPYDNLRARRYPAMLVKTSFNDPAVMYWEPAKYVARLRTLKRDRNPLLFKTNLTGSHGGASGRYDRFREIAFDYAFLLTQVGIRE
jgi:oligopeptidase B